MRIDSIISTLVETAPVHCKRYDDWLIDYLVQEVNTV